MSFSMMMALALAAPAVPERCRDDRGQDRCNTAMQTRMRDAFGLEPIEVLAATGAIVRRVMYVDGYGRNLLAIEFLRAPGSDPMVRISLPASAKAPSSRMEALIGAMRWASIVDGSRQFHRTFAPLTVGDNVNICLHSWVYTVEAADPGSPPATRQTVQDACQDSPAEQFASLVAKEALAAIEPCAALDRRHYRNEATMLATCFRLKGDRQAAAELFNRTDGLAELSKDARTALDAQSYYKVVVDWDGMSAAGAAGKALLKTKLIEGEKAYLFITDVRGQSPRAGVATGRIERYPPGGKGTAESATVELVWDLQWRQPVTAVRVGPWKASSRP